MDILRELFGSVEFWMGLSVIATAVPGPQNRLLPALLRALAKLAGERKQGRG